MTLVHAKNDTKFVASEPPSGVLRLLRLTAGSRLPTYFMRQFRGAPEPSRATGNVLTILTILRLTAHKVLHLSCELWENNRVVTT